MNNKKHNTLPDRNQIPNNLKWDLSKLYPSLAQWEEDYGSIKNNMKKLIDYKGRLATSGDTLYEVLNLNFEITRKAEKLYVYAKMKKDENNADSTYQALTDKAFSLLVELGSIASFIVPEILAIPEERLKNFIDSDRRFDIYKHYLDNITRQRHHILSTQEEQIVAMTGDMSEAINSIFSMLNDADLKFPEIKNENGVYEELTHGRYILFMKSRDRQVRKNAFTALYDTYEKFKNTLTATLSASIKRDIYYSNVRKYPSALEASLDQDNVPLSVYENLIDTVHDNLIHLHRYMALRKRALGLNELHMYDLFTPIIEDVDIKVPYEKAKEYILEGLNPLGREYGQLLVKAFEEGWIDVMENRGKTSGAYSWGHYDAHPYILLNYQDNIDNVYTLAHELGHAIHSYYSNKNQPYVSAGYKIFVAEVASTLNEILLTKHLLNNLEDRAQRAYILNHYLEQFRTTVYRQTMFAEFEKITHEMSASGNPLTPDNLNNIYHELNAKYYGNGVVIDKNIDLEWARIPHFYSAFYVYKYATGFSAAAALSQQILDDGPSALKRYLDFLSRGGSDYPINLLKVAGVDMTSPLPIKKALEEFGLMVDEMEKLI
ncbi:MAG: oligoendopeptidase F [Mahellales bacterium]|jgi:oligoendopeptidase F